MLKPEQVAAIESHLKQIERRQRRIEFLALLVLAILVVGMLSRGDLVAFSASIVIGVGLAFIGVLRTIIAGDAADRAASRAG